MLYILHSSCKPCSITALALANARSFGSHGCTQGLLLGSSRSLLLFLPYAARHFLASFDTLFTSRNTAKSTFRLPNMVAIHRHDYHARDLATRSITIFPSQAQVAREAKNVPIKVPILICSRLLTARGRLVPLNFRSQSQTNRHCRFDPDRGRGVDPR